MNAAYLDNAALTVLAAYPPPLCHGGLIGLGNRGGFSGARLWRVDGPGGFLCLRAWPPGDLSPDRLTFIHHLMTAARQASLDFVPDVFRTRAGPSWVEQTGRLWDLTTWLPGRADFRDQPTTSRLEAACSALARLHAAWAKVEPASGPSPSLQRRQELIQEWSRSRATGWRPCFDAAALDPVQPWAEKAWQVLGLHLERIQHLVEPWLQQAWPLQPCLGDVWHDHCLFEGETLTGLVDYGGVKRDHVAVDLARLLGSLVGDDARLRVVGLRAYQRLRPLTAAEETLVQVLDESGTLLGAANWLKWLYLDQRVFEDRLAVARRLSELVERIENWNV